MTLNIAALSGLLQKQEKVWGEGKDINSVIQRETHGRQNVKGRWNKRWNHRERERETPTGGTDAFSISLPGVGLKTKHGHIYLAVLNSVSCPTIAYGYFCHCHFYSPGLGDVGLRYDKVLEWVVSVQDPEVVSELAWQTVVFIIIIILDSASSSRNLWDSPSYYFNEAGWPGDYRCRF